MGGLSEKQKLNLWNEASTYSLCENDKISLDKLSLKTKKKGENQFSYKYFGFKQEHGNKKVEYEIHIIKKIS